MRRLTGRRTTRKMLWSTGQVPAPDDWKEVSRVKRPKFRLEIRFLGWHLILIFG
jgi:hypothetical protein